jgi:alpha-ketoglutarate-dependent taurine dioxygenase
MRAVPRRFDVRSDDYRREAIKELLSYGAIILSNVLPDDELSTSSWEECAKQVPFLLFSPEDLLLKEHEAAAVHVAQDGFEHLKGKALPPHTDGYIWGDYYPDVVVLVCEQSDASGGGENYLLDGERVVDRLDEDTVHVLKDVSVDHTERTTNGMAQGAESIVPVLQWRPKHGGKDRLAWRRMVDLDYVSGRKEIDEFTYVSLWAPMGDHDNEKEVHRALLSLDQAILAEDRAAERFMLQSGEVLIVDNFRMLHARAAYSIGSRRTWRVWSWTRDSNGLPPDVKDKQKVPATVKGAEALLSNQ